MKYWNFRCTKSIPNIYTTTTTLMLCLRHAARKYWLKWKTSRKQPSLTTMHKIFSAVFAQEYAHISKVDEVLRRAKPMLNKFVNEHPQIDPLLIGTSFETPFPVPKASIIVRDSIDLVYKSRRGTENILIIANGSEHDMSMICPTVAYIGYQSIKQSSPYTVKMFSEKKGFTNIKIGDKHLNSLVEASNLLSILHDSKNKAKHVGLACAACPYKSRCWR